MYLSLCHALAAQMNDINEQIEHLSGLFDAEAKRISTERASVKRIHAAPIAEVRGVGGGGGVVVVVRRRRRRCRWSEFKYRCCFLSSLVGQEGEEGVRDRRVDAGSERRQRFEERQEGVWRELLSF